MTIFVCGIWNIILTIRYGDKKKYRGGIDVMLLDELSQGSKKTFTQIGSKEKWWLHKLQKENAGTTKWTTTTTNTISTLLLLRTTAFYIRSRLHIRMYEGWCRILMKYRLRLFFISTIRSPDFDNWILCDLQ